MANGSDGSLAGLWAYVIKGALQRDWNVFVVERPGQQSTLFERDVSARRDWEAVLALVVDLLVDRPDAAEESLLAYGFSQGGYWPPPQLLALRAGDMATVNQVMTAATPDPEMARTSPTPPMSSSSRPSPGALRRGIQQPSTASPIVDP